MPLNSRSRRQRRSFLPAEYRQVVQADTPAIISHWRAFMADGNRASFHALIVFYLPLVQIVAAIMVRRHPGRFDFEDAVSDGTLGLMQAIPLHDGSPGFKGFAKRRIRFRIWDCTAERSFGPWLHGGTKIITEIRAAMIQDLGRLPTPEELTSVIASKINNPNFHLKNFPEMQEMHDAHSNAPSVIDCRPVDERLIGRETKKLATKGFSPEERRLFNRVLRGEFAQDIAREMGVSDFYVRLRINGLLWRARCNKRLAEYAGFEAANGELRRGVGIHSLAPARKIA